MVENKKNPKVDLRKKTGFLFSIGLVVSLALVIMAFEWEFTDYGSIVNLSINSDPFVEVLEIPPTIHKPPHPPIIQHPKIIVVPDKIEIEKVAKATFDIDMKEKTSEPPVFGPPAPETVEIIFTIVEEKPEPNGGFSAFYKYVQKNLKYPGQARRMNIEGKVFVQFIIDKDGSITKVKAIKGIGAGCDEEAVRVISGAPKWNPGKQRGRPVKVRMTLPITFKLR